MLSYQAVEVIAAGAREGKDADPEKLRDAIAERRDRASRCSRSTDRSRSTTTGQNENATVIVMQNLKGKVAQVYPEEFADRRRSSSRPAVPGLTTVTHAQAPRCRGRGRRGLRPRTPGSRRSATVRSCSRAVYTGGGQGLGPGHPGRGDRPAARRRLRARLGRSDADLRRARHRQLRPGRDAHARDVPRLRARPQRRAYPCTSRPLLAVPIMFVFGMVVQQLLLTRLTISGQPRRATAGHPRPVPADRQRAADGLRRSTQDGARHRVGSVQVLGARRVVLSV